jgi:hypothetical protein
MPSILRGVAAALLLGFGYWLAHQVRPAPPDIGTLRADVAREVRENLSRELASVKMQIDSEQAARQKVFAETMVDAIRELEARQIVADAALRKDLETLAVRAQLSFDQIAFTDSTDERGRAQQR